MTLTDNQPNMATISVADVALTFPHAMEILNHHNLDYCCGGKKSFAEVCEAAGLNAESIWQEINIMEANHGEDNRMRFDTWDVPLLINFIIQHHHHYVRQAIPQIQELLDKVCSVHGEDSPWLINVRENFSELAEELLNHLPKEEKVLFPALQKIFDGTYPACEPSVVRASIGAPIEVMEHEHDRAGALIKSIRSQTDAYTLPPYACPTFKLTYTMLSQFDKDLMQHIHLENNILFPKVMGKESCL